MTSPVKYTPDNPFAPSQVATVTDPATPGYTADNPFAPKPETASPRMQDTAESQGGFLDYLGNAAKQWIKANSVMEFMGNNPGQDPKFSDPEMQGIANAVRASQANGSGVPPAFADLQQFFVGIVKSDAKGLWDAVTSPVQTGKAILEHPINFVNETAKSVIGKPVVELAELQTGLHLTGYDVQALTPEEKAQRVKDTIALGVTIGTGAGMAKALDVTGAAAGARAAEIAKGLGATDEVANIARSSTALAAKGGLAKQVLKHATVGAVSGATYGGISQAGSPDELPSILTNAIQFGTLGGATALLMPEGKAPSASDISQVRQLSNGDNASMVSATRQMVALSEAESMPEAILKSKLQPEEGADITLANVNAAIKQREAELAATPADNPERPGIESTLNVLKLQRDHITGSAWKVGSEPVKAPTPGMVSFGTPSDLADAVLSGQALPTSSHAVLVQGVDLGKVGQLGESVPPQYRSAVYVNPDGTGDLLVHDLGEGPHEKFFEKTGFLPDQVVSHDGSTNWKVVGVDKDGLQLQNRHEIDPLRSPAVRDPRTNIITEGVTHGHAAITAAQGPVPSGWTGEPFQYEPGWTTQMGTFLSNAQVDELYGESESGARRKTGAAQTKTVPINQVSHLSDVKFGGSKDANGNIRLSPTSPAIAVSSMYDEWRSSMNKQQPSQIDFLEQQHAQLTAQRSSAPDNATLRSIDNNLSRIEAQIKRHQEAVSADNPIGFDEVPPEDFMDRQPEVNVQKSIDEYFKNKNFDPATTTLLKNEFYDRLAKESFGRMSGDEQSLVTEAQRQIIQPRDINTMADLRGLARSNAMDVLDAGSRIVIRDSKSGKILRGFDTPQEAAGWIRKSGQASGVDLVQNGVIPTANATGGIGMPPSSDPHTSAADQPYEYMGAKPSRFQQIIRYMDNIPWMTGMHEWSRQMDERFGTEFHARVVEPLSKLKSIRNNFLNPLVEKAKPLFDLRDGLTPARREVTFNHIQTRSPEQLEANMNEVEKALGRQVHSSGAIPSNILQYNRQLDRLDSEFPIDARNADPKVQAAYDKNVMQLREAFSVDDKGLEISTMFNNITKVSKAQVDLGKITRYAQSLGAGTGERALSQDEYAAKMKMTPKELQLSRGVSAMYKELAKVAGLPPEFEMDGYITHARTFYDGDIPAAVNSFTMGNKAAKDFAYALARTGEISAYDKDPASALIRYMKALADNKSGLSQALADAENYRAKGMMKVTSGTKDIIKNTLDNYVHDVRGFPTAGDQATRELVAEIVKQNKLNITGDAQHQLVDALMSTTNASLIGLKPSMGINHWLMSNAFSIADRSLEYTGRANIRAAYARAHADVMAEVRAEGGLSTVSSVGMYSASERALERSQLRRAVSKTIATADEVAFRLTGLPDIFESMSAGHYLTSKLDALNALTKWRRGEISWNDVKKQTFLNRHAVPDAREFESLVRAGKDEDASKFLGRQTVQNLLGYFDSTTRPTGWSGTLGHIAAQYGRWPRWYVSALTRLATTGTTAERIGAMAKFAGTLYGIKRAGESVGVNMHRFAIYEPFGWFGGPFVDMAFDAHTAISSSGYVQQQAQRRLERALPITQDKWGSWSVHPGPFVPGSYAADGWMKAYQDYQNGNVARSVPEALGYRPSPTKR